jgi:hypothetical protein
MSWKLISKTGVAPVTEVWQYKSRGRRYILTISYYYDVKGDKHLFGYIHLSSNIQTHIFLNLMELQKFLQKRRVPFPSLEVMT